MKIYKNVFPCKYFLKKFHTVGGESQTEIFGYNTEAITFLKKLGKFTNWLKNNVVCPEITNNIPSFVLRQRITIFDSPSVPNTF